MTSRRYAILDMLAKVDRDQEGDEAVEQAISYARHPEVSASYSVVLNGVRLVVYHSSQRSTDAPIVDLATSDPASTAQRLWNLLSPAAIRRDCSPPIVDLGTPLADGFRSRAAVLRGEIVHDQLRWAANFALPTVVANQLDETSRRLRGLRIPVNGGEVFRDDESRIRAKLTWSQPHDELLKFAIDKNLMDVEYIALGESISTSPETPSVFDVIGDIHVAQGERLFDLARWESKTAGISMRVRYTGRATGYLANSIFCGVLKARYYCEFPTMPSLEFGMEIEGSFSIELDNR